MHSLTWENIQWAFQDGKVLGVYEPVGWVFKAAVLEAGRTAAEPLSQAATALASLMLHAAAAVLSHLYTARLLAATTDLGRRPAALAWSSAGGTALVFCHPQRAEAVAWLSAQVQNQTNLSCVLSRLSPLTRDPSRISSPGLSPRHLPSAPRLKRPLASPPSPMWPWGKRVYCRLPFRHDCLHRISVPREGGRAERVRGARRRRAYALNGASCEGAARGLYSEACY